MKYLLLAILMTGCATNDTETTQLQPSTPSAVDMSVKKDNKPKEVYANKDKSYPIPSICQLSITTPNILSFNASNPETKKIYSQSPIRTDYLCTFHYYEKNQTYYFQYDTCKKVSQLDNPNYHYYLGSMAKSDMPLGTIYGDFQANIISLNSEEIQKFISEYKLKRYGFSSEFLTKTMNINMSRMYVIPLSKCN